VRQLNRKSWRRCRYSY